MGATRRMPKKAPMGHISHVMIIDEENEKSDLLSRAIVSAEWSAEIECQGVGVKTVRALYRNIQKKTPTDLVIVICVDVASACLDTIRMMRNYPGMAHLPVIVFCEGKLIDEIANKCHMLGVIKVLEMPEDFSHLVMHIMMIKSHFSDSGSLSPHRSWINSSRLAVIRATSDRIMHRMS
jgi:hypothetical protein